jgi:Transmembrane Fragile-X-F protein
MWRDRIHCIFTTVLVTLKVTGHITLSWWWILCPLWVLVFLVVLLFIIIAIFTAANRRE